MSCQKGMKELHMGAKETDIKAVCECFKKWQQIDTAWDELAQALQQLTGARICMVLQYDDKEDALTTKGVAGFTIAISKAINFLGADIRHKKWRLFDGTKENIMTGKLIFIDSVEEASFYSLPAYQSFCIQKMLGIELIYSMGLIGSKGDLLGNVALLIGKELQNEEKVKALVLCAAKEIERLVNGGE